MEVANQCPRDPSMSGEIFHPMENPEDVETKKWNPLQCPLCNEPYEDPCILTCFHSFCQRCLRGRAADAKMTCPICGTATQLKDVACLPSRDVLLKFMVESSTDDKAPCANCDSSDSSLQFQTPDDGNERLWEDGLGTPIDSSEKHFTFTSNYQMFISAVTVNDTGIYLMKVVLASTDETEAPAYVTTASLVVKVSPAIDRELHLTLHPQAVMVTDGLQPGWHVKLSCGTFLNLGQPPITVRWTISNGTVLPSTSYENGVFFLIISNPVQSDSYSCQVDPRAPAVACASFRSPVRAQPRFRVEAMEARVILLEACLSELPARDTELSARITELTDRDAQLAARDNELAARDDELAANDTELAADVTELTARVNELTARGVELAFKDTKLAYRDTELMAVDKELAARDIKLTNRDTELSDLNTKLTARVGSLEVAFINSLKGTTGPDAGDGVDRPPPYDNIHTCKKLQDTYRWITIQRRYNGSVDFYRGWQQYEDGFGDDKGEFWLGLKKIHEITMCGTYMLRVELQGFDGDAAYAEYSEFFVRGPEDFYRLFVTGYSGTAGDAMAYQNNRRFSAKDQDKDDWPDNCAVVYHGAWWYGACHHSNLNGRYKNEEAEGSDGVVWREWTNHKYISLKSVEMKIVRV